METIRRNTSFYKKATFPEHQFSKLLSKLRLRFLKIYFKIYWNKLAITGLPVLVNLARSNGCSSISNIGMGSCQFLPRKESEFWNLHLVIFL